MPKDNIERAIKKGTGELEGVDYVEVLYEAYGPGGVAIMIQAVTDNPTRTVADVRHKLSRNNGNMGSSNSVAYLFDRKGQMTVDGRGRERGCAHRSGARGRRRRRRARGRRLRHHHRAGRAARRQGRARGEEVQGRRRRTGVGAEDHRARSKAPRPSSCSSCSKRSRNSTTCRKSTPTSRWTKTRWRRRRSGDARGDATGSLGRSPRAPCACWASIPGTAVTGYGVVAYDGRTPTLVECGVIRTTARDPLPARLHDIHAGVTELIGGIGPTRSPWRTCSTPATCAPPSCSATRAA